MTQQPFKIAEETFVIPSYNPVPGVGLLYMNALVIRGREPILVDTGATIHSDAYIEAAFSLVDPLDVRWIFLSHEDRDHAGSLMRVLDMCPNARLVTNAVAHGKLSEEWVIPPQRVYYANSGESFDAGDRMLTGAPAAAVRFAGDARAVGPDDRGLLQLGFVRDDRQPGVRARERRPGAGLRVGLQLVQPRQPRVARAGGPGQGGCARQEGPGSPSEAAHQRTRSGRLRPGRRAVRHDLADPTLPPQPLPTQLDLDAMLAGEPQPSAG